jgi:DNA-binding NarL/FixJ family response regulator
VSEPKRVVIVEDDGEFRKLLSNFVQMLGFRVAGVAKDGLEAIVVIRRVKPDLVLLDLRLPGISGVEVMSTIRAELPYIKFIVITGCHRSEYMSDALAAGAEAYIQKPPDFDKLRTALECAARGYRYVDPEVLGVVIEGYIKTVVPGLAVQLTPRQREVGQLLSEGLTSPQISEKLGISVRTVEQHRALAMERVGAKNAAELVSRLGKGLRSST